MKKSSIFIIFLIGGLALYFIYPYYNLYTAKNLDNLNFNESSISLILEEDIKFSELGDFLKQKEVIKDVESFNLLVEYKKGYSEAILTSGKITIKREWLNNQLINQLYLMRNQKIVSLAIPSLRTIEDLSNHVAKFISADSISLYAALTDPNVSQLYGFSTENFPCMFIPNTYEVYSTISADEFIALMAKEYKKFWTPKRKQKAADLSLSQSEITILASIVQKEQSMKFDEHSKIAGLYINRLRKNMKLQADPTVKFALNQPKLRRLYYRHLEIDSPYNTYKYTGLPPGPICIVDSRVIDAVLNYKKHDFIFMCAQPAYSGYHNFSSTNAQHEKYKKEYTSWLKKENIH